MSVQRKRGEEIILYRAQRTTDTRGNPTTQKTFVNPHRVKGWVRPERSTRAEVPGQQEIDVVRIGVPPDLPDVELWSLAVFRGRAWDVVSPPSMHRGIRRTRHWEMDCRSRGDLDVAGLPEPDEDDGDG